MSANEANINTIDATAIEEKTSTAAEPKSEEPMEQEPPASETMGTPKAGSPKKRDVSEAFGENGNIAAKLSKKVATPEPPSKAVTPSSAKRVPKKKVLYADIDFESTAAKQEQGFSFFTENAFRAAYFIKHPDCDVEVPFVSCCHCCEWCSCPGNDRDGKEGVVKDGRGE